MVLFTKSTNEESRINTGVQRRPKSNSAAALQKRIDTLNERYKNQEIDAEQLLNSLLMLVPKRK
jgi:hypothetical protein